MYFQFIVQVPGEITFCFLLPARKNTAHVECPLSEMLRIRSVGGFLGSDFGIFVYS